MNLSAYSKAPVVRARILFVATLVTLAPATASAQSSEDIVRSWLDAIRSRGATVETGGITQVRGKDVLEIRDLRITPPKGDGKSGGNFRVPSVFFVGLARGADGGLTARGIKVGTIEGRADDGSATVTVSDIEGANIALPDFSTLSFDPARPFRSQVQAMRLVAGIRADSLTVGRVDADFDTPQGPIRFSYDGVGVSDMAGGRIARFVSGAIRFAGSAKEGGQTVPVEVRVGKAEVLGYDIGGYLKVIDDEAYVGGRGDGVWREVQKSASLDGISVSAGPAQFSIARATVGAMRMRQAEAPLGAVLDRATADPKYFEANPAEAIRFSLGLLGTMALEHYTLDGWSIQGPELERFQIGRVQMRDLSPDGLGEFSVDGVDAAAQGNLVRFARFAFGGMTFPDSRAIAAAVASGGQGPDFDPFALAPTLGFLRFDGASVDVAGKGRIDLGSFSMDFPRYIKAVPTAARILLKNLSVPTAFAEDRQSREVFATLGYDRLDLSGEISARWDEATGDLRVETISAGLADGGSLAFDATIGNVPRTVFSDPPSAQQAWVGFTLKSVGLGYRDASLVGRLLRLAASQTKQQPEVLRDGLIAGLPQFMKDIRDPELRGKAIAALTTFLRNPTGLTVVSRLARPLPITQVIGTAAAAPPQLPNLLQLEVAVSP